jgi:hypothetical protein
MKTILRLVAVAVGCYLVLALTTSPAHAQFQGSNLKGDFGLQSASQAPPGFYLSAFYVRYEGDTLRDRNGDAIAIDPAERGSIDVNGYAAGLVWVSKKKLWGANYSAMVFPGLTDNVLEVPILDRQQKASSGPTDVYVQPINLGWHTDRADYIAGLGVFAPTGRYDADASDNTGLGMWSFELFGGATVHFGKSKSWNFATTAFYETHTEKQDTDITVGDILTLEGGLGKSFKEGAINVGAAYYAQWKVTDDDPGQAIEAMLAGRTLGKHRVFGVGPELTIPIATKKKLIAFLTARYLWESGARTTLEGETFVFQATFPIPSVSLQ